MALTKYQRHIRQIKVEVVADYMAWLAAQGFLPHHICQESIRDWAIEQGILPEPEVAKLPHGPIPRGQG